MSEEHYPARSTGNDDIVALDIIKMFESLRSSKVHSEIEKRLAVGEKLEDITGNILDTQLTKSLYPKGRTARTLCRKCNTFYTRHLRPLRQPRPSLAPPHTGRKAGRTG